MTLLKPGVDLLKFGAGVNTKTAGCQLILHLTWLGKDPVTITACHAVKPLQNHNVTSCEDANCGQQD